MSSDSKMALYLNAKAARGIQYRKIPKISRSKYTPLPRGACTWKIVLKYKVKQS